MKDIRKLLKEQSSAILPDERVRENIRRELYPEGRAAAPEAAYAHGGTTNTRKNWRIAAFAAALAIVLLLTILLPLALRKNPVPPIDGGLFNQISDDTSFYAYGAASVGAILSFEQQESFSAAPQSALRTLSTLRQSRADAQAAQTEKISRYLSLVEGLLSDSFEHRETQNTADRKEYDFQMVVTVRDLLGNSLSYTMYYNKIPLSTQVEDGETEENYAIRGVLLVGDREYLVEGNGEHETEIEPDETEEETEMTFLVYHPEDPSDYIRMEQELSTETEEGETEIEQKYVYTTYVDGREVERTTVEYEQEEDGELELKLVVEADDVKDELLFQNERGTDTSLRVRGKLDGEDTAFRIYIRQNANGDTYYDFVFDQTHYEHDRFDDEEEDD